MRDGIFRIKSKEQRTKTKEQRLKNKELKVAQRTSRPSRTTENFKKYQRSVITINIANLPAAGRANNMRSINNAKLITINNAHRANNN